MEHYFHLHLTHSLLFLLFSFPYSASLSYYLFFFLLALLCFHFFLPRYPPEACPVFSSSSLTFYLSFFLPPQFPHFHFLVSFSSSFLVFLCPHCSVISIIIPSHLPPFPRLAFFYFLICLLLLLPLPSASSRRMFLVRPNVSVTFID